MRLVACAGIEPALPAFLAGDLPLVDKAWWLGIRDSNPYRTGSKPVALSSYANSQQLQQNCEDDLTWTTFHELLRKHLNRTGRSLPKKDVN